MLSQTVASCPTGNLAHSWEVHGDGTSYDGRDFADQVIAEWNAWLQANGLDRTSACIASGSCRLAP